LIARFNSFHWQRARIPWWISLHYTHVQSIQFIFSLQILRRLIITFQFEVSGEQLPTGISTWTCKFTLRILPIYKVCPQTYLQIYFTPTYDPIQACMGTYHSAGFACMLLPWKPMYFEQFICVCVSYTGTFIVQVTAHNLKKIWWYLNIAEMYYLLCCIHNYLNYQYKYWDM